MYAHEVLNDIQNKCYYQFIAMNHNAFRYIQESIKFNLGNCDDYKPLMTKDYVFNELNSVRLPYPLIWFDWVSGGYKEAVLIKEESPFIWLAWTFIKKETWLPTWMTHVIMVEGYNKHKEEIDKFLHENGVYHKITVPEGKDSRILHLGQVDKSKYNMEPLYSLVRGMFYVVDVALRLLNCKNVIDEIISIPTKLNKKRIKKNKPPKYEYRILKLIVPTQLRTSGKNGTTVPLTTMPLHLRKGHFKKYSEARKLFGKYTGEYWWPARLRGNKKNGIIEKEYSVRVKDDTVQQ